MESISSVNGEKISLKEFEDELKEVINRFNIESLQSRDMTKLKKGVLDKLIEKRLLFQEAIRLNITVNENELDKRISYITEGYSPLRLREVLESKGMTFQGWRKKIRDDILIEKVIDHEVNSKITISEEELKDYYELFSKEFFQPLKVHALQIVVETEGEANTIRKEILKGADFAEMAKTRSLSPDGKKGGDLGFFSKGEMPKEFDDVVFNLKIGEVSEVIPTIYGYHIFKVLERREAKKMDFSEAREKIKRRLRQKKQKEIFLKWIKELRDKAEIIIRENNINKLTFNKDLHE